MLGPISTVTSHLESTAMATPGSRLLGQSQHLTRFYALPPMLLLLSGCATGGTRTIVEGQFEPRHFRFVTVVTKSGKGPGGWRAACVYLRIARDPGPDSFLCRFGVEMPLATEKNGAISTALAQRISADCASLAAQSSLSPITPTTPLGLACQNFKSTYDMILSSTIVQAKVKTECHKKAEAEAEDP